MAVAALDTMGLMPDSRVTGLLGRLGVFDTDSDEASGIGSDGDATPVDDLEVESLGPAQKREFSARLSDAIQTPLARVVKQLGILQILEQLAAKRSVQGIDFADFTASWAHAAENAWLKDRFRDASPGMHEWIPSNLLLEVLERARREGVQWIHVQHQLRSPTAHIVFAPAKSSSVIEHGGERRIRLHGHVGAVYAAGHALTTDQADFHDELRAAFRSSSDPTTAIRAARETMARWLWRGDRAQLAFDSELEDGDGASLIADGALAARPQLVSAIEHMFDRMEKERA